MKFKGTKGEWTVEGLEFKDYTPMSISHNDNLIAEVYGLGYMFANHSEESRANAQLISSAPDLLKALIGLYNAIDSSIDLTPELLRQSQQAINKALNK